MMLSRVPSLLLAAAVAAALAVTATACGSSARTPATSSSGAVATAELPPLIPREVLFGNPERGLPALSPDGKQVAFSAPADGVMNVFVAPVGDLSKATQVTFDRQRPIRSYDWSADGRFIIYAQDKAGDENFHVFRVGPDGKGAVDLTPGDQVRAQLLSVSPKKPGTILVGLNDRNPQLHDVHEVDLATGQKTLRFENPGYVGFVIDFDQRVRMAQRMDPDGGQRTLALGPGGQAREIDKVPQEDSLTTQIIGFEASGQRYYLQDSRGRDTAAVYEVDATSGERKLLAEHPKADAAGTFTHPTTGVVRAVAFDHARKEWKVLDKSIERDLAALAKLDEGDVDVVSTTLDDRHWVVMYAGDRRPVRFYAWDRDAQKGTFLYTTRPALDALPLARMHPVTVKSRDGLEQINYLTLPVHVDPDGDGKANAPAPMVLLVHGGPWARVSWGYSPMVQLLANRGYAVLQPNFRGSTGFGKGYINAADRQWGKAMHDDLIDAVDWAVAQGVTTAEQVCIMGGSYGGYATLAGLTFTPTKFRCGVDIVGPSNLETLLASVPPYWKPMLAIFHTRMGDPSTPEGKAALQAASPVHHADKIVRPLLIAQGANDPRVKQAESDQIVDAMRKKGLPVTYVLFPDEGHGFSRPENNLAFTAVTEAFLSVHLGGRAQPMAAADFAGSTMQVLEGRDGIPGLPAGVGAAP